VAATIKNAARALNSRRDTWAPAYGGVGVGLLTECSRAFDIVPTAATVGTVAVGAALWVRARVGDRLDRAYRYTVLGASTSYVLTMHEMGHPWWQLPALVAGTVALGVPWWNDNRKAAQVRLEGSLARWPEAAKRLGMSDTSIVGVVVDPVGNHHGRIVWPAGAHTVRSVMRRREEIEGALDLPTGTLRLEYDGRNSNAVRYRAMLTDPHAESIPWQIPTEEIDGELYLREGSVADPITLGVREDGTAKKLSMFVRDWGSRQLLAVGAKGSGKSGLLNLLIGTRACARDAVQWGIDLKGGVELGPWEDVFDWLATTYEDALRMLEALEAVIDARAAYMRRRGWKVWRPDRDHPVLVLTVDECHSLYPRMGTKDRERLERIKNKGRALGVETDDATQYPTLDAIGSSQIREQVDQRFGFRMNGPGGEGIIFNGSAVSVGLDMIPGDRPGTCYHRDNEELDTSPTRILHVEYETIRQLTELRAGYTTPLDEASASAAAAAVPEYLDRSIPLPRDGETGVPSQREERDSNLPSRREDGKGNGTVDESDIPEWAGDINLPLNEIERRRKELMTPQQREADERERERESRAAREAESRPRLGQQEALEAVGQALREAGPAGVRASVLMKVATRDSSWLYETALKYYRERGEARRTKHGTWAWSAALADTNSV